VSRRRLVTWLVALGAFEALYGLVQYLTGWQRIFGYVKKYNLEEATGTYINRNHFAGFLEMVIPFGVALVLFENAKLPRKVIRGQNTRIKQVLGGRKLSRIGLWLLAATVMVAGLFFFAFAHGHYFGGCIAWSDGSIFWISTKSRIMGRCGDHGVRDHFGFVDGCGAGARTFWNDQRRIYKRGREQMVVMERYGTADWRASIAGKRAGYFSRGVYEGAEHGPGTICEPRA